MHKKWCLEQSHSLSCLRTCSQSSLLFTPFSPTTCGYPISLVSNLLFFISFAQMSRHVCIFLYSHLCVRVCVCVCVCKEDSPSAKHLLPIFLFFCLRNVNPELTPVPISLHFLYIRCLHSVADKWSKSMPGTQTHASGPLKQSAWNSNHSATGPAPSLLLFNKKGSIPLGGLSHFVLSLRG